MQYILKSSYIMTYHFVVVQSVVLQLRSRHKLLLEVASLCQLARLQKRTKKTRADHADEPEMNVHFATNFLFANPRRKKYFLVSGCDVWVLRDIYNIQD